MSTKIRQFILDYFSYEFKNILKEKHGIKNITYAFRGIGEIGEELATIIYPDSLCSPSKGGCAFDNNEYDAEGNLCLAREIKTCCLLQPKICKSCLKKTPYFQDLCVFCKTGNFKYVNDSRFSIDSKAHFEYEKYLKEYILILIEHNNNNNIFNIKIFKINSDNKYFTNYLKNQLENSNKSNTCNLLPYSYDFYASGPIKLTDITLDFNGNIIDEYIDINNGCSIDFDTSKLNEKEKTMYGINGSPANLEASEIETKIVTAFIPYEEIKDKLVLREKKLNKNRGVTSRL
jgi:hypothetical protein